MQADFSEYSQNQMPDNQTVSRFAISFFDQKNHFHSLAMVQSEIE